MARERQQPLGIFTVPQVAPDYRRIASDIVQQVWRDTRGSPSRPARIPPGSTLSFWKILAGFIEQATLAFRRPVPAVSHSNIDGACQGIVRMINREIRAARGLPDESAAECTGPDQHILEALDPDERTQWGQLAESDRARLTKEFRGGQLTAAGRSYLKKKIALLSPGTAVVESQEAAVEKQPASCEGL